MSEEYIEEGINGQWTDWKFEAENYKKIYEHLYQENQRLKEEIKYTVPIVEHNKIVSEKNKENQQLKEVIEEAKTAVDYMIGNVDISEIHGTKLKQILDKVSDSDE